MHFLDTTVLILIYRINIIQFIRCQFVVLLLSSADVFDWRGRSSDQTHQTSSSWVFSFFGNVITISFLFILLPRLYLFLLTFISLEQTRSPTPTS